MIEFVIIKDKNEGTPAKTIVEAWLEKDPLTDYLCLYCREGATVRRIFELNPDGTGRLCICTQLPSLKPDGIGRLELI